MTELESLATTSDEHTHKLQESYGNKLKTLESQVRLKVTQIFELGQPKLGLWLTVAPLQQIRFTLLRQ